jgi:hypothetical protein
VAALALAHPQRGARAQVEVPHLGQAVHFVLYYSYPVPGDPAIVGACRAGWINHLNEDDGTQDLTYLTAKQPNEHDNPPPIVEFKFRRHRDPSGEPGENGTWHYPWECPRGN